MQYAVHESHERRQAFLEFDALLDHLFRHVRRFVTSNPLPSYIRSVVVAFRCDAYDGKSRQLRQSRCNGCNDSVAPQGKVLWCKLKYCDTSREHMVE